MPTYHIDPTGIDTGSRNGLSLSQAWRTPGYALPGKLVGDIIWAHNGSYSISSQVTIPQGVSLEGDGVGTLFDCSVSDGGLWRNNGFAFLLENGTNTSGQHISNIKFDGLAYTGYGAIGVWSRNNVEIHHCTVDKFSHWGIRYYGGEPPAPGSYITGSRVHHNTITDSAGYYGNSLGCLGIGGIDGMLIYNNTISQPALRGQSDEGEPIYGVEGFIKNVKIYNNTISKTLIVTGHWDFAIEIWNWQGGNEIYDNSITGSIDLSGASKGTSSYSVKVYRNVIGQPALQAKQSVRGILFECRASDVIIEQNYFHHVAQPIFVNSLDSSYYGGSAIFNNNIIRYNTADNIGAASGQPTSGWGIYFSEEQGGASIDGWYCYNNVFVASINGTSTSWGISLPDCGTANDVIISNNIVKGFAGAPVRANNWGSPTSISNLKIQNNIFYGNGNSNDPYFASGVTHSSDTINGNLKTLPPFISSADFHLTAVRTGIFITSGLFDKDGTAVSNPPTIGAFEYNVTPPPSPKSITSIVVTSYMGSSVISSPGGTLQMYSTVLPLDASNPSYVWSVIPGTGSASISLTGLLIALTDGIVIVRSTAQDGSGVYGEKIIIISGQLPVTLRQDCYCWFDNLIGILKPKRHKFHYGALYNWDVINSTRGLVQLRRHGVIEDDWIVFNNEKWDELVTYLGGISVAGGKLKEKGLLRWLTPNTGATDEERLRLTPGGKRSEIGTFSGLGSEGNYLSSDENDAETNFYRFLENTNDNVITYYQNKRVGQSVRLIRNIPLSPLYVGYGLLYNWYAASDVRRILSIGWHVPTVAEVIALYTPLGDWWAGGGPLKETGTTYWDTPNTGATNSAEFNGRGGGLRIASSGNFIYYKQTGQFMIDDPGSFNWGWILEYNSEGVAFGGSAKDGSSIRALKDSTTLSDGQEGTYIGNDGTIYKTICIGTQEWMAENLRETKYRNGDLIPIVTSNSSWIGLSTGAMCWFNNIPE